MELIDSEVEDEISLISQMWGGGVYITYYPGRSEWAISNTTDEGLPVGVESKIAYGNTLEEAIDKVKNGDFRY